MSVNTGTVQQFGASKNGKPKVQIDSQWYFLGKTEMTGVSVGDRISFEAKAFGERGDLWGLQKWAKVPASSNGVHADPPKPSLAPHPSAPYATPSTPTGSLDEPMRQTCSNIIANLARAGTLKSPDELDVWIAAIKAAFSRQPGEDDDKGF